MTTTTSHLMPLSEPLTLSRLRAVAEGRGELVLDAAARQRLDAGRARLTDAVQRGDTVYGLTTGVGDLRATKVSASATAAQQLDLVRTHACAIGQPLPQRLVRAAMASRASTLAKGYSGVRPVVVESLLEHLRLGLTPVVPADGSVGASGDPVLLAHIARGLIGEGPMTLPDGSVQPADVAQAERGVAALVLDSREGLALINGLACCASRAALAVGDVARAVALADRVAALTLDACHGCEQAFARDFLRLRGPGGHLESGQRIRSYLAGRAALKGSPTQDPYCLRCVPQFHGAAIDTLAWCRGIVERDLDAVVDNPLVLDDGRVAHGGHFHGQAIALAADALRAGISTIANGVHARISFLLRGCVGLPPMLPTAEGSSGLMMLETSAAGVVARLRADAAPMSVHSLSVSSDQEDHTSMAWEAVARIDRAVSDLNALLAVETVVAMTAARLRDPRSLAPATVELLAVLPALTPTLDLVIADTRSALDRLPLDA